MEPTTATAATPPTRNIGIPYAEAEVTAEGKPAVVCPICGEWFAGASFKTATSKYGKHYAKAHDAN